jgi:hydrogenase maturation protease
MTPTVDVLVCGSRDRGDDAAPLAAAELLRNRVPPDVRIRVIGRLNVDHLLSIPRGSGVVIVDAAMGVGSGTIVTLPLRGFISHQSTLRPRSAHALAMPEVIGGADMIRGRPLVGRIVLIGARRFGLRRPLSRSVAKAVPTLAKGIESAVDAVRVTLGAAQRAGSGTV